jgi:hypothetical protein
MIAQNTGDFFECSLERSLAMDMQNHIMTQCCICGEVFWVLKSGLKGKNKSAFNDQLSHSDRRYCEAFLNLRKFMELSGTINDKQEEYCYENG